jgi:hypothetical protein
MQPVIASNGVPFLQMKSVGSHSTSGREKEGKEGMHGGKAVIFLVRGLQVLREITLKEIIMTGGCGMN